MTDEELIARLRENQRYEWHDPIWETRLAAADRIEQLVATNEALTELLATTNEQRDKAWESLLHWRNKSFDLEEKLALMTAERDEAWKRAAHAEKMWGEAEVKLATCEKYRDAYVECDRIGTQAVRDLEAKLAECEARLGKAVRLLSKHCNMGSMNDFDVTTLAELKEESREVPDR